MREGKIIGDHDPQSKRSSALFESGKGGGSSEMSRTFNKTTSVDIIELTLFD